MKIIAVFQEALKIAFYFVWIGFILVGCSAPKRPYYFSRYTNQGNKTQKIEVDSVDSTKSMIFNAIQKEDLMASTSQDAVIPYQENVTIPIPDRGGLTKNQTSHKQQKMGLIQTWKAMRKVKSTLFEFPDDRKTRTALTLSTIFGFLILMNSYVTIAVVATFLILLISFIVQNRRESRQEIGSEEELKIKKKKNRLIMPLIILGGMILSCVLILFGVWTLSWIFPKTP